MAEKRTIEIEINGDAAVAKVEALNSALIESRQSAAGASDGIKDLGSNVDSMTGGAISKFKGLIGTLSSVATGFKSVGVAIAATGLGALLIAIIAVKQAFTSSEEGQNKWAKIMGFIGAIVGKVTDGLASLGDAIIKTGEKAVKGFAKIADGATKAFDFITFGIFKSNKALKDFENSLDRTARKTNQIANDRAKADRLERSLITERAEADRKRESLLEKSEDRLKFSQKERIEFLKQASKIEEDITNKEIAAAKLRLQAKTEENKLSNSNKEALNEEAELKAKVIQLETARISKQKEVTAKVSGMVESEAAISKASYDQRLANQDAFFKARLKAERDMQDIELMLMDEGREKDILANNIALKRKLEDLKANVELTANEKKRLEDLFREQAFEAEKAIELKNTQDLQLAIKPLKVANREELLKIDVDAGTKEIEEAKRVRDEKVKIAEEEQSLKRKLVYDGFQAVADIAFLFANQSEAQQKKAFQVQKAASIAQGLMDTYSSAIASYRSLAAIPVTGVALGVAAAATATAAGLANVKRIASTKFGSTTAAGAGASFASASGVGIGGSANFNVVGDTNFNQLDIIKAQIGQPIKAFVVGGEVTTQQALDRNKLATATL